MSMASFITTPAPASTTHRAQQTMWENLLAQRRREIQNIFRRLNQRQASSNPPSCSTHLMPRTTSGQKMSRSSQENPGGMSEASGRAYISALSHHRSIVMRDATTFPIAMIPSSRKHSENPTHHKLTSLTSQGSARTGGRLVGQGQPHQTTLRKPIQNNLLSQHIQ